MSMTLTYSPSQTTVMILAAGQGKRMLPLTQKTPKPLLKVGKYALIEHHLRRLKELGFQHIAINIAYLASQIQRLLGDGQKYGLTIEYSDESSTGALETAGGICQALPLIKSDPFMVINADIWTDFDFSKLLKMPLNNSGRLVLVPNPTHNPNGDFTLTDTQQIGLIDASSTDNNATFSGIALYKKILFSELPHDHLALAPVLRKAITENKLQGILYHGDWQDIGTPERLHQINQCYQQGNAPG